MDNQKEKDLLYKNYGEFVIEFERLVMSLRTCIFTIFSLNGLKDFELLRIILHDQTANPLSSKLQTLISIQFKNEPERIKVLDKLFIYTNKIIERRNELVHGFIFYDEHSNGFLFKDKTKKTGLTPINENIDNQTLIKQTKIIIDLKEKYEILNSYFHQNDSIFEHFFNEKVLNSLKL